jgi:hypothetical protein
MGLPRTRPVGVGADLPARTLTSTRDGENRCLRLEAEKATLRDAPGHRERSFDAMLAHAVKQSVERNLQRARATRIPSRLGGTVGFSVCQGKRLVGGYAYDVSE